jgi:hypothetical integral membrane protein (TIGR02206 family)
MNSGEAVSLPPSEFAWYGPSHWVALLLTVAASVAVAWSARRARRRDRLPYTVVLLRVIVTGSVLLHHVHKLAVQRKVPLEMCDWTGNVAIVALFTRHPLPAALLYYWGLTLSPQALITPDLEHGFPSLRFFLFFVPHGAVVAAAAYTTWGRGLRLTWRLYACAAAISVLLLTGIQIWNTVFNDNYMYLMAKPVSGSILDFFGPWPVYVIVEVCMALGLWAAITPPFTRCSDACAP